MLRLEVPSAELWSEAEQLFFPVGGQTLELEHSLLALSKWESRWRKPFLVKEEKTAEETLDYIRCMTITEGVGQEVFLCLTDENIRTILDYIGSPMTATTIQRNGNPRSSREAVTSEVIYYYMAQLQLPFECEAWHLNRLLTLIEVCNVKNSPSKKVSRSEILSYNAALNKARREQLGTRG